MNSAAMWKAYTPNAVDKEITRLPIDDAQRIRAALDEMETDPLAGNVKRLASGFYRRRVGDYRILLEITPEFRVIRFVAIH